MLEDGRCNQRSRHVFSRSVEVAWTTKVDSIRSRRDVSEWDAEERGKEMRMLHEKIRVQIEKFNKRYEERVN
ncbi:hypothetical protein MLD38_028727 [Melastoma candidum]|uniref:Uncharacterized protein n=1 Tax=Melastoma candidum TaxID=119954 RepID=A0ACB9N3N2_9MYRT|nr:hypothetical protein MLD38_028727 [Melastoma candidum]